MRVHDSQAYRKMDVTRERNSRILELREILLSLQAGFIPVNAAAVCAILRYSPGWHAYTCINAHTWKISAYAISPPPQVKPSSFS